MFWPYLKDLVRIVDFAVLYLYMCPVYQKEAACDALSCTEGSACPILCSSHFRLVGCIYLLYINYFYLSSYLGKKPRFVKRVSSSTILVRILLIIAASALVAVEVSAVVSLDVCIYLKLLPSNLSEFTPSWLCL